MEDQESLLLLQWEPKVHSILISFGFRQTDTDYEDVAQNLRIKIITASRHYDPSRGLASFHTYLHVALRNATQDFLAIRKKKWGYNKNLSLDLFTNPTAEEKNALQGSPDGLFEGFGHKDEYFPCPLMLTGAEAVLYNLLMMDMTYKEIVIICTGDVRKTFLSLRKKVKALRVY